MLKLLLVVAIFAAVTYLVTRMLQERGPGGGQPRGSTPRGPHPRIPRPKLPPRPTRPVAPDDDEDFLRDLDRKRLKPPPDQDG